ncbi:hypothetical protein ACO1MN_16355, partial [Staphylococcus aureus]
MATAIINRHRTHLDRLAATLLSNEVLEREDIDRIMEGVPAEAPRRVGGELGIAAASADQPHERPREAPPDRSP